MKKKDHLPILGIGPFCGMSMTAMFLIGAYIHHLGYLVSGDVTSLKTPFRLLGGLLIAAGAYMWIQAVIVCKIDKAIIGNKLFTSGIYSCVRNPIYSAIAIVLTGLTLMFANLWMLFLPVFYWLDITLLMKATEEKWLLKVYGEPYINYCKNVNRCIPWFPKKD